MLLTVVRRLLTFYLQLGWIITSLCEYVAQPGHLASTHIISICIARTSSGVDLRVAAVCNVLAINCDKYRIVTSCIFTRIMIITVNRKIISIKIIQNRLQKIYYPMGCLFDL